MLPNAATADLSPLDRYFLSEVADPADSRHRISRWLSGQGNPGEKLVDALVRTGMVTPEAGRIARACRTSSLNFPVNRDIFSPAGMAWLAEHSSKRRSPGLDATADRASVPGVRFLADDFEEDVPVDPPRTVGSYVLRERLGRGPNGSVHAAECVFGGERVAVKLIPATGPAGATIADRFLRGAAVARRLALSGCPTVREASRDFDHAFLVYPVLAGKSLKDRLLFDPPVPAEAANACAQAARVLANVHAAGHAHGNISAGNLLMTPNGVVLADFALPEEAAKAAAVAALQRSDVAALVRVFADLLAATKAGVPAACRDVARREHATATGLAEALEQAVSALAARATTRIEPSLETTIEEDIRPIRIPKVGDRLGKCRLTKQIGKGATGVVFRAEHQTLGIDVAVKVLSSADGSPAEAVGEFSSEARMLARLNHPNVVRIWDFEVETEFPPFLVLELVDGQTLNELIQVRGALPAAEAVPLFTQVIAGLAAAQRQVGLIHRDIKPANILLGSDGSVKVADLGLSSMFDPEKGRARKLGGTVSYMAPEQSDGTQLNDHRSDIYSLGITMYQAVTGHLPFAGKSRMEIMFKHAATAPPPIESHVPDFPPALSAIILKMIGKKPEDRFPSYEALLAAIEGCRTEATAPATAKRSMVRRLFNR